MLQFQFADEADLVVKIMGEEQHEAMEIHFFFVGLDVTGVSLFKIVVMHFAVTTNRGFSIGSRRGQG